MFHESHHQRRLVSIAAIAAVLLLAGVVGAIAASHAGSGTPRASFTDPGYQMMGNAPRSGYGGMMGEGGSGMIGGGYGSSASSRSAGAAGHSPTQRVKLQIKSDTERGKRGPDGNWHDAFLPANFTVRAGATVKVTVLNYDDMPHSFTSQALGLNVTIPGGWETAPSTTTFTFTAPSGAQRYMWWCALPCDPFSMSHVGYMRGYISVRA
jgi:plastocyanin